MKKLVLLILLLLPAAANAELVYFEVQEVQSLSLVTSEGVFELAEFSDIKNQKGVNVPLSKIKLPASAKAEYMVDGDRKILKSLILIGGKNNRELPE